jgi:hypothetical protein
MTNKLFTIPGILLLLTVSINTNQKPALAIEPCMGPDSNYTLVLPENNYPYLSNTLLEFAVYTNSSYAYKQTVVFLDETGKEVGEASLRKILPDDRVKLPDAQAIMVTDPYAFQAKGRIAVNVKYQISKTGNCSGVKSAEAGSLFFQ